MSSNTGGNTGSSSACSGSVEFTASGAAIPFVVPNCATRIKVDAYGAEGGSAYNLSGDRPLGGKGAYVSAVLSVSGGETFYVFVGGRGGDGSSDFGGDGGWNGGGLGGYASGSDWIAAAAGGGGATDLRRGGTSLAQRVLVAAGGGGAGGACYSASVARPAGGAGGLDEGEAGGICQDHDGSFGYGGTQSDGGVGGNYLGCIAGYGDLGWGGDACYEAGGGGGGGYFGGGAGAWGGGGGGSSYVLASATSVTGATGQHRGGGLLVITW